MAQTLYSARIPDSQMPSSFAILKNIDPIGSITISTRSNKRGSVVDHVVNHPKVEEDVRRLANVVVNCNRPVVNKVYNNNTQKTVYACPVRKKGDKTTCYGVLISETHDGKSKIKHQLSDHLEEEDYE